MALAFTSSLCQDIAALPRQPKTNMSDVDRIRDTIRESVNRITGIAPADVKDSSNYRQDLGLDSLSALEVMVDIEYAFRIKVPEERLPTIQTVQDTIAMVQEYLGAVRT
jgi:acyl carrier protein